MVPGVSADTCQAEIEHLHAWATANNLQLNRNKTKEIIFSAGRNRAPPPPPRLDIKRETTLRVLGVIVNDKLTAVDHVTNLLSSKVGE